MLCSFIAFSEDKLTVLNSLQHFSSPRYYCLVQPPQGDCYHLIKSLHAGKKKQHCTFITPRSFLFLKKKAVCFPRFINLFLATTRHTLLMSKRLYQLFIFQVNLSIPWERSVGFATKKKKWDLSKSCDSSKGLCKHQARKEEQGSSRQEMRK